MSEIAVGSSVEAPHHGIKSGRLWAGRIVSALPALGMLASASMKLMHSPEVVQMFTGKFGYQEGSLTVLALVEISCALLYLVPQTAVLGAVLVTGYLGGAIATHVRVGDAFLPPLVLGVLAWLGLYLRDPRIVALLPLRKP
jgi:hypothetical protein